MSLEEKLQQAKERKIWATEDSLIEYERDLTRWPNGELNNNRSFQMFAGGVRHVPTFEHQDLTLEQYKELIQSFAKHGIEYDYKAQAFPVIDLNVLNEWTLRKEPQP